MTSRGTPCVVTRYRRRHRCRVRSCGLRGSGGDSADGFKPVVEVRFGALAEVGAESAGAPQAGQLTGSGAGDHEPVAADDIALDATRILQQERPPPAGERSGDPLDPDEARRAVRVRGLDELHNALAPDG